MNPPQQGIKTAVLPIKVGQISLDCHCNIYDATGRCVADNLWPDDAKEIVTALNNYASIEQENQRLRRALAQKDGQLEALIRALSADTFGDAMIKAQQTLATDTKGGG